MYTLLLLALLPGARSFAQSGGGSVQDTALAFHVVSADDDSGGGSVRDTAKYMAVVKTYTVGKKDKYDKNGNEKSEVTFYRLICKKCCLVQLVNPSPKEKFELPPSEKVTNPATRKKLQASLTKQIARAYRLVK